MDDESHDLELTRYIHLNPFRARIVERPEEYDWSSYQDYLGVRKAPAWLDCESVLGGLATHRSRARAAYRRFVEAGLSGSLRSPLEAAVGGMFLGSEEWVTQWRRRLAEEPVCDGVPARKQLAWRPTLEDVVATVSQVLEVDRGELLAVRRRPNDPRSAAIYLVRHLTNEPVGEIGRYFGGVSTAAISKTVARAEERRVADRAWDRRLKDLSDHLRPSGDRGLEDLSDCLRRSGKSPLATGQGRTPSSASRRARRPVVRDDRTDLGNPSYCPAWLSRFTGRRSSLGTCRGPW